MIHVRQKAGLGTCGAVAYASILHLTELQGVRECNTKMRGKGSGTHDVDLCEAFKARGIQTCRIDIERQRIKDLFWLAPLSTHFPLYVSTSERKNGSRHAVAIADAMVYDGHNDSAVPLELYLDKYVDHLIVVDIEIEKYGSNS